MYKAKNRSRTRWLPSQGHLGLDARNKRRNRGSLGEGGTKPQQACTTIFFLIPKNVTSEMPIAPMPTLIRWREALTTPEVENWQQKYRVDWDATDGRDGGAQQTVWEILMEMERFYGKAKEEDQGAVALVLDLAKSFERFSLPVCAWATHSCFPRKILRVLCGYF